MTTTRAPTILIHGKPFSSTGTATGISGIATSSTGISGTGATGATTAGAATSEKS